MTLIEEVQRLQQAISAKEQQLRVLQQELSQLYDEREAVRELVTVHAGPPARASLREPLLKVFQQGGTHSVAELVNLVKGPESSLRTALNQLIERGEVERVSRGYYRLADLDER